MVENSHTVFSLHSETKFSDNQHRKRDRVLLKDITNEVEDPNWQLCKREQFAISLRKEKKKLILSKKRANLAQAKPQVNLGDCFADLHPAFSDRFTTVEDKNRLLMQILRSETQTQLQSKRVTTGLLKSLAYTNRMLGFRTSLAVPSQFFLDEGILDHVFTLVFHLKPLDVQLVGKALQVLANMACLHPAECFQAFTVKRHYGQSGKLLTALVHLAVSCGSATLERKIFRVIYNLVIEDQNQLVHLLQIPETATLLNDHLYSVAQAAELDKKEGSFSQMLLGFTRVLIQVVVDDSLGFLIEEAIKKGGLLQIGKSCWARDQHLLEAIRSELESNIATSSGNMALHQFIDCNYRGHLEELLVQAEADCAANFDRINLPLQILTQLGCYTFAEEDEQVVVGQRLRVLAQHIEAAEVSSILTILTNLQQRSTDQATLNQQIVREHPRIVQTFLLKLTATEKRLTISERDQVLEWLHRLVAELPVTVIQDLVGLGLFETLIQLLQMANSTPMADQLCICTLHCLLKSSISVIDLFVAMEGLDQLDQLISANTRLNEECKSLADELASNIRHLINQH